MGWCYPSTTWRLVCPLPRPNSILGLALSGPKLALGHACECPSQTATWHLDYSQEEAAQASCSAWAAPKRKQTKRQMVLCWGLGVVLPKRHVVLSLPTARIQFYFRTCPTLPCPRLALGHACECPNQSAT